MGAPNASEPVPRVCKPMLSMATAAAGAATLASEAAVGTQMAATRRYVETPMKLILGGCYGFLVRDYNYKYTTQRRTVLESSGILKLYVTKVTLCSSSAGLSKLSIFKEL